MMKMVTIILAGTKRGVPPRVCIMLHPLAIETPRPMRKPPNRDRKISVLLGFLILKCPLVGAETKEPITVPKPHMPEIRIIFQRSPDI